MVKDISVIKIFAPGLKPLHAALIYGLCNYMSYAEDCLYGKHFLFFFFFSSWLISFSASELCISMNASPDYNFPDGAGSLYMPS